MEKKIKAPPWGSKKIGGNKGCLKKEKKPVMEPSSAIEGEKAAPRVKKQPVINESHAPKSKPPNNPRKNWVAAHSSRHKSVVSKGGTSFGDHSASSGIKIRWKNARSFAAHRA